MNKNSYGSTLPGTGSTSTGSSSTDALKDTLKDTQKDLSSATPKTSTSTTTTSSSYTPPSSSTLSSSSPYSSSSTPSTKTDGASTYGSSSNGDGASTASKLESIGYEATSAYGDGDSKTSYGDSTEPKKKTTSTYDTKKDVAFDAKNDLAFDSKKDTKKETQSTPKSSMKSSAMDQDKEKDMKKNKTTDGAGDLKDMKLDDLVTTGREALGNVGTQIQQRPYVAMAVAAGLAFGVATILGSRILRWAAIVGGGYAISRLMRGDSLAKVGEDVKKRVETFVTEHASA